MNEFNVVMFGASRSGKTQLVSRYTQHTYTESYEATIEDLYKKEARFDGKYYSLKILDTQGVEQFKAMRDIYISKADAFVIVYDANEAATLSELESLARGILEIKDHTTPMVIVGAKHDKHSASRSNSTDAVRVGARMASGLGKPHVTCSAKLNYQVDSIFEVLARQRNKCDASRPRDGDAASSAMSNISIDGWLNSKLEREYGVRHQPSLKQSMVKLKRSIAKLNGAKSMRNLRKVLSTASFHKSPTSASTLSLREAANCNRRNAPANSSSQPDLHAFDTRTRKVETCELPGQGESETGEDDMNLKTVTQSKLSELPHIQDVSEKKHHHHNPGKRDGVCVIM